MHIIIANLSLGIGRSALKDEIEQFTREAIFDELGLEETVCVDFITRAFVPVGWVSIQYVNDCTNPLRDPAYIAHGIATWLIAERYNKVLGTFPAGIAYERV